MRRPLKQVFALFVALSFSHAAMAANVPLMQGPWDPGNALGTINNWIQKSLNPSVATTAGIVIPKNALDNSNFQVNQRGSSTAGGTCGTTTIPETAYGPDRWGCNVNVTSGAGTIATVTSTPSPPIGAQNSMTLNRTSGALLQPQCVMQEVPTTKSIALQGQVVDFSAYMQALAGLSADNGNAANLYIFTGTGTDQGLQSFTASPAITPAWTGIATLGATNLVLTGAWARYSTGPVLIPTNVTEIAVALCFTPTATGAGSTDGFAVANTQLEPLGANATGPSVYEVRDYATDLADAERYYVRIVEPATGVAIGMQGTLLTTTTCALNYNLPVTMFKAPVFSNTGTLSTSTWKIVVAADTSTLASTFLVSPAAVNSIQAAALVATLTTASTAGWACQLQGQGGTSSLIFGADY